MAVKISNLMAWNVMKRRAAAASRDRELVRGRAILAVGPSGRRYRHHRRRIIDSTVLVLL